MHGLNRIARREWIVVGIHGIIVQLFALGAPRCASGRRVEQRFDRGVVGVDVVAGMKRVVWVRGLADAPHTSGSVTRAAVVHDSTDGRDERGVGCDRRGGRVFAVRI
eukprot:5820558-Pleurochrysis_carterae.AAC.1